MAVPAGREAPLPLPFPQRVPVEVPHPRLQQHRRCRGVGHRQRRRLPGRAGEPDHLERQPAPHGSGRAGRSDRRLHQRAGREPRARRTSDPTNPLAATPRGLRSRRSRHDRPGPAVPGPCPQAAPTTPRPPGSSSLPHPGAPPGGHGDPAVGADRRGLGVLRRLTRRGTAGHRGRQPEHRRRGLDQAAVDGSRHRDPGASAPPRYGRSTTPPPTPTPCTSTRSPSKW